MTLNYVYSIAYMYLRLAFTLRIWTLNHWPGRLEVKGCSSADKQTLFPQNHLQAPPTTSKVTKNWIPISWIKRSILTNLCIISKSNTSLFGPWDGWVHKEWIMPVAGEGLQCVTTSLKNDHIRCMNLHTVLQVPYLYPAFTHTTKEGGVKWSPTHIINGFLRRQNNK